MVFEVLDFCECENRWCGYVRLFFVIVALRMYQSNSNHYLLLLSFRLIIHSVFLALHCGSGVPSDRFFLRRGRQRPQKKWWGRFRCSRPTGGDAVRQDEQVSRDVPDRLEECHGEEVEIRLILLLKFKYVHWALQVLTQNLVSCKERVVFKVVHRYATLYYCHLILIQGAILFRLN